MRERPIICRDDEVRAFLEGRKTRLRRPITPIFSDAFPGVPLFKVDGGIHVPLNDAVALTSAFPRHCPFGVAGDRLWARECFTPNHGPDSTSPKHCIYRADDNRGVEDFFEVRWTPSSQMPRWASRIMLTITNVRVERLQDITKQDAISEGVKGVNLGQGFLSDARCAFRDAWDHAYGESINAKTGEPNDPKKVPFAWRQNPFVWVIAVEVRT